MPKIVDKISAERNDFEKIITLYATTLTPYGETYMRISIEQAKALRDVLDEHIRKHEEWKVKNEKHERFVRDLKHAVSYGQKINAIKIIREHTGVDLRTAKDIFETIHGFK